MKISLAADGKLHIEGGELLVDRNGVGLEVDRSVLATYEIVVRDLLIWGVPFPWRLRLRILLRGRP